STLANALAGGERMATQEVRASDGKGRHTTTHRELLPLEGGAWLIDTAGMREVGMTVGDHGGLSSAFEDIAALAAACRFHDCAHGGEPGCAVNAAIATGELEAGRLASYRKLLREEARMRREEKIRLRRLETKGARKPGKRR
ncbi:GTPase RsgA, partial [Paenibacillus dendritiformis]|uniref:GTPase RsgA n=1 Tax=Paenibacillus dendritiformis TaxID=130049 RepID=UPI00143E0C52